MGFSQEELLEEEWRQCTEADYVEVSSLGRVRTKTRRITNRNGLGQIYSGRFLRQARHTAGYWNVSLRINGRTKTFYVHRLVASAFLKFDTSRRQVNHKNGIRSDTRIANLEYVTCGENHVHRYRVLKTKARAAHPNAKLSEEQVRQIRASTETHAKIGLKFGIARQTVSKIKSNTAWIDR